ncbi:uncharacterized protein MELLADRAFT_92421 [Melampsora larici-populina 98AG31]|uniref:GCM domain-containing protein n=1 Tax=Melampsora larici-populina (strain 98AG31 / pathotype 3-4-7) TaxID=747676 RepID=F4R9K8_MELLP|nr:uncharacterized protein MELLADRAFT_92421 [Melampsora larici-populina 98AG31]EGG10997.1 hypothetical protein MELLADRAFT_92421 [Melampsora larici-populina 98AG31]
MSSDSDNSSVFQDDLSAEEFEDELEDEDLEDEGLQDEFEHKESLEDEGPQDQFEPDEEFYESNQAFHEEDDVNVFVTESRDQPHQTTASKSKKKKEGVKGKKTFGLPQDRTSFETFIDADTTLDEEGYPFLPNGNTVYVRQPQQQLANWGTFAYTYTTSGGGTNNGKAIWQTVRFKCLGVIVCDNPSCDHLGSPPTAKDKRDEFHTKPQKCDAARCPGYLRHITCSNTLCRMDEHCPSGWGIIRHSGVHLHQWPRRRIPDKLAQVKFAKKVVENPDVGPLRLKVGRAPAGKKGIVTASAIHPAFGHIHHVGYYRRKILSDAGLIPEKNVPGAGDSFLLDMIHWIDIISASFKRKNTHLTFQTEWMAQQLLSRDEYKQVYAGGLLSDVTYKFFANGYLLSTSMYHEDLCQWIPIQMTWLNGLSEEHYRAHFTTLMEQMRDAELTTEECDTLVRQVVDFSVAQKNGFIMAYMDVFQENDREVALDKMKGCHEHFRAQVTRVKRNRAIIPAGITNSIVPLCIIAQSSFEHDALDLLKPGKPGGHTFDQKIALLRKAYPKAKKWLQWWQASDIKAMLFKSSGNEHLPATTNAQESLHRVYYMICEGNCTVQIGLVQLFALVQSLERDHVDRKNGVSIEYGGKMKNYKKVAQTLGWAKKKRRPKRLGRPKGSLNVDRNPVTTYQGFVASNTQGRRNRCWLNAMTECLYALHTPLWYSRSKGKSEHIFTHLMIFFSSRSTWEMCEKGSIKTILTSGQNTLHAAIQKRAPGSFEYDAMASADGYFDGIFDRETRPHYPVSPAITKKLFQVGHRRKLVCPQNSEHRTIDTLSCNKITLTEATFGDEFSYAQTPDLLQQWCSDTGLRRTSARHCRLCKNNKPRSDLNNPESTAYGEKSQIIFDPPPPHLHISIDVGWLLQSRREEAFTMMADCDFPYELILHGVTYWIRARGYWGGNHFWCKVVRTVGGVAGVWLANDQVNAGLARLVSTKLESIGGPSPNTSWVMYSRSPTEEESSISQTADAKIKKALGKKLVVNQPFSQPELLEETREMNSEEEEFNIQSEEDLEHEYEDQDEAPLAKRAHTTNVKRQIDYIFSSDGEDAKKPDEKPDQKPFQKPGQKPGRKPGRKPLRESEVVVVPEENIVDDSLLQSVEQEAPALVGNTTSPKVPVPVVSRPNCKVKQQNIVSTDAVAEQVSRKRKKPKGWKGWEIVVEPEMESKDDAIQEALDEKEEEQNTARRSKRAKCKKA